MTVSVKELQTISLLLVEKKKRKVVVDLCEHGNRFEIIT